MAVAATDVPGRYDLVLTYGGTSYGYCFADSVEPSLPFRTHRAAYTSSPTFIDRQNVQGSYGDDFQSFWQIASQNDWSLGEDQKFFRTNDSDSRRKYYQGTAADVRIEGQVGIRDAVKALTAAANPVAAVGTPQGIWFATSTTLYLVDSAGTITSKGAHGLGVAPASPNGMASDGTDIFLSSTAGGTVGVRRYNGAAFSTFSATGSDSLAFLNNTLYGYSTGILRQYDTAGAATTKGTWTTATGAASGATAEKLMPLGGQLVIFRGYQGNNTTEGRAQLWLFDGVGIKLMHSFEPNFYANDMTIAYGTIFVSGTLGPNTTQPRACVVYLANGTPGQLWKSKVNGTNTAGIVAYDGGVVWVDQQAGQFVYWDPSDGSIHRVGAANRSTLVANTDSFMCYTNNNTAIDFFPNTATRATTATVVSSLFDFDSSLDKYVRAVKADFDLATDGNGGSVDIAYQINGVDGSWTTLQTGAVAGTEYFINQTCRSIAIRITLNKGTSTKGPVLKRSYVRAVPILLKQRRREYLLDCTATAKQPRKLRDGTYHSKTGREMADDLITASQLLTPLSVTDRFGTISSAFIDLNDQQGFALYEIHPSPDEPGKSGSFIAQVLVREV